MGALRELIRFKGKEISELDPTDIENMLGRLKRAIERKEAVEVTARAMLQETSSIDIDSEDLESAVFRRSIITAGKIEKIRRIRNDLRYSPEVRTCKREVVSITSATGKTIIEDGSIGEMRDFKPDEVITGRIVSIDLYGVGTIELADAKTSADPNWRQHPNSSFSISHVYYRESLDSELVPTVQIEPGGNV